MKQRVGYYKNKLARDNCTFMIMHNRDECFRMACNINDVYDILIKEREGGVSHPCLVEWLIDLEIIGRVNDEEFKILSDMLEGLYE